MVKDKVKTINAREFGSRDTELSSHVILGEALAIARESRN
jgi:hypothetical protein